MISAHVFWWTAAIFGYTLVGYPILITLFARMRRPSPVRLVELPLVSLIIPAHNEQAVLDAKIRNALAIDYPRDRLEIIVASDGSTDDTVAIAERYAERGVHLFAFTQRRGKQSALTDAVCQAKGEVLCLCDANVMFQPDALRTLVNSFSDSRVGAVTGDVRIASHESNFGEGESLYYRIERRMQWAESQVGSLMGVDGGMYVIRRQLFPSLPPDTILDDFVISMRVIRQGFRVVYEPLAVAHENGTPAARQEWRRRVRVAAGAVQSIKRREWPPIHRPVELWQYVSHKALRWTCPLLLTVLLVSNLPLFPDHWIYKWALGGQCAAYLAAGLALVSIRFRGSKLGGIPFYVLLSNGAMAWGLIKGLLDRQPVTWDQAERVPQLTKCR